MTYTQTDRVPSSQVPITQALGSPTEAWVNSYVTTVSHTLMRERMGLFESAEPAVPYSPNTGASGQKSSYQISIPFSSLRAPPFTRQTWSTPGEGGGGGGMALEGRW